MGKLIAIIICVIFSAYFSATETALSTFNKIRVKNLAEKGNKKAALVIKLSESYDTLITTILIGNNIVNILAASLSTLLFTELLKDTNIASMSATLSTVVLTLVVLTFGEISPKTIAKKHPESFSLFAVPFINILVYVFFPLSFLSPVKTGLGMAISFLVSVLFYKEKFGRRQLVGVTLGVLSVILINVE